jgi:hypothetical protein
MRDGGKGDKPRPIPNYDEYANNWDRIFKEKDGSLTITVEEGEKCEYEITRNCGENLQNEPGSI